MASECPMNSFTNPNPIYKSLIHVTIFRFCLRILKGFNVGITDGKDL
jgi:hypothetical protein